jgi:hypothetical protein
LWRGWGFTIPNERDILIAARAGNMERAYNALYTEAQDMLLVVFVASKMGCQNVLFETDSDVVKQGCHH